MYRKLIAMAKTEYLAASNRFEKSVIVSKIIEAVHDASGVFLKKVAANKNDDNDDGDGGCSRWVECSESFVREKIAQSIRDGLPFKYSSSTSRKRERAAQAQKQVAGEKRKREYEQKLTKELFSPTACHSMPQQLMKQPSSVSVSAPAPAPAALSLMLERTFLERSGSDQNCDTAGIANQAMEILSGDGNNILDDVRIAEELEIDIREGGGDRVHRNDSDYAATAMNDNYGDHNHHHHDYEPMPLSSDEEDEALQLEMLQLTAHNDHDELWPRPHPVDLSDGSRRGNGGGSEHNSSSSNDSWGDINTSKSDSSSNSKYGDGGDSGDVYQSFMRQHWEDLPTNLSPTQIAEEIITTFQRQQNRH